MKKSLLLLLFLSTGLVHAQDYLSGKIQNSKTPPTDVLYDRTQSAISSSIFQTIYKIVNKNKKQLYSIILTHDRVKSVLLVSIKPETSSPYGVTVTYKKNNCGLIFNDNNPLPCGLLKRIAPTYFFSPCDTFLSFIDMATSASISFRT